MDEDVFEREVFKKSVFREEQTLALSYVPEKLPHRTEDLKRLIHNFRGFFGRTTSPPVNVLILGKGGIGKTALAKYFAKGIRLTGRNNHVKIYTEYYNCVNFRTKSAIMREVLSNYCFQTGKGYSDDDMFKKIQSYLERENACLLLTIDEVFVLPDSDIISLVNFAETFPERTSRISLLLVSRELDWARFDTERITSRIQDRVNLKPYGRPETREILDYRRRLAFNEGAVPDDVFELIVDATFDTKNIRTGIEMFLSCGRQADGKGVSKVNAEMVRFARDQVYSTFQGELLDQFKVHELLTLQGVTHKLQDGGTYTNMEDAYKGYRKLCELRNLEPHTITTFRKNIRNLTKVRIISGQTKQIAENQRGRYMEITLLDIPAEELEQIIGKMLDRKIARGIWFEDDVNVLASNCVLNSAILKEKAPMAPKSNKLERLKSPVLLVFLGIARTIKKVSFPTVKSEKAYEEYKLVCNE